MCRCPQKPEKVSDTLELELPLTISCLTVVLGTKLGSSGTAASTQSLSLYGQRSDSKTTARVGMEFSY